MADLPVSYLVDDAAIKIGDPNKTRVRLSDWLVIYNESVRELCGKANVMHYRATFNLTTTALYHYPDEMTVMSRLETSETPTDDDSWRIVEEIFEDEFRAMTSGLYPTGPIPHNYFADKVGFYLVPRPQNSLVNGGRITYFGLPDRIFDFTGATFPLPQYTQDYVMRRMVIYGKMARNRVAEATKELELWYTDVEGLQDKIDDRSDDRRSSLKPRRQPYAGMR